MDDSVHAAEGELEFEGGQYHLLVVHDGEVQLRMLQHNVDHPQRQAEVREGEFCNFPPRW